MKRHACGTLMVKTKDAIGRMRDRCPQCHGVASPPRRRSVATSDDDIEISSAFVTESEE